MNKNNKVVMPMINEVMNKDITKRVAIWASFYRY